MGDSSRPAAAAFRGYGLRQETWTVAGRRLELSWPADIDALLDLPITEARFRQDEYMPYWAQPWPASVLLAEAIFAGPAGQHRPAIEIGCGVGLASMAAAMTGWSVTATDYDADAVAIAGHNAERNGVTLAGAQTLDYRKPLDTARYELILGADLLYERRCVEPVARWIASALLPLGQAWLSDPNRSAADGFPDAAIACGLSAEAEQVETTAPAGLLTRGRIWRVRVRPAI